MKSKKKLKLAFIIILVATFVLGYMCINMATEIKIEEKIEKGQICIDYGVSSTYYEESSVKISGWVMANVSNTKIKVTVDGDENIITEDDITRKARQDVIEAIEGYGTITENPTPGFSFNLDLDSLNEGKHTLKITLLTEEENELASYTKNFTIDRDMHIQYTTHVENIGWQSSFLDGKTAGTTGKSLSIEGIKIIGLNLPTGVTLKYRTHVENVGWQSWKTEGTLAGTTGKGLQIEGIKIMLENTDEYSIMYRAHVQNKGWQSWKYDGELAGTEGQSLGLEAIEIKIVDKVERGKICVDTSIDTFYEETSVKVSGWAMASISNTNIKVTLDGDENKITEEDITRIARQDVINAIEGYGTIKENPTSGFSFNLDLSCLEEGTHTLKIEIVKEDGTVLETYTKDFKIDKDIHVGYTTHIQNIGWTSQVLDGTTSGTSGQCLRLEGIKIEIMNLPEGVTLKYQTHVQDLGWQGWKDEGSLSGTEGQSKRLEAIKIKLQGTTEYSIMYRTHVQDLGWQEWCYDGEASGTCGESLRIEAIQIKIVPKISEEKATISIDSPSGTVTNTNQVIKGWVMSSVEDTKLQILIDGTEIDTSSIGRTARQDALNANKGYGNEDVYNPRPGFQMNYDFSSYSIGTHTITINAIHNGKTIGTASKQFTIRNKIEYSTGTYGYTGLAVKGDSRGSSLTYYKYGSGSNVMFATFAIHGFEDLWSYDGQELIQIANDFFQYLINSNDSDLAEKWTIYIFPGVNIDGAYYGTTNNGAGRTTLYSAAPNNKGIDMNRCWQTGSTYTRYTSTRNYNGTAAFQAYEAQYLRTFMLNNKSASGQTVVVDLHGWTQQVIGDSGICSYYSAQFPENNKSSVGSYGTGYLINWARSSLGSTTKTARSALIELPNSGVNGHAAVVSKNFSGRYIQATINMLKNII